MPVATIKYYLRAGLLHEGRLAAALAALDAAEFTLPADDVLDYARAMQDLAEQEVAGVPAGPSEAAVRYTMLGTILVEPLLLALRRLAQIDASARRFGADCPGRAQGPTSRRRPRPPGR